VGCVQHPGGLPPHQYAKGPARAGETGGLASQPVVL